MPPSATIKREKPTANAARVSLLVQLLKLGSLVNGPMKDGVCAEADVSQIELKVLMALKGEGALAGHDLVEIMGEAPMNISRAIASLRKRGWIEDARDPDNRRRKPVKLSPAGTAKYASMTPMLEQVAIALVGNLSAKDRAEFARIADLIIGNMADWITGHHSEVGLKRQDLG
jgi:DNA-binding MarR family transcriptional regulator